MWLVYLLVVLIPVMTYILRGRHKEKKNNDKWYSIQRKLFTDEHYRLNAKDKRDKALEKEEWKQIRDRQRMSGKDYDDEE
jgi:hypothetical protein